MGEIHGSGITANFSPLYYIIFYQTSIAHNVNVFVDALLFSDGWSC